MSPLIELVRRPTLFQSCTISDLWQVIGQTLLVFPTSRKFGTSFGVNLSKF